MVEAREAPESPPLDPMITADPGYASNACNQSSSVRAKIVFLNTGPAFVCIVKTPCCSSHFDTLREHIDVVRNVQLSTTSKFSRESSFVLGGHFPEPSNCESVSRIGVSDSCRSFFDDCAGLLRLGRWPLGADSRVLNATRLTVMVL